MSRQPGTVGLTYPEYAALPGVNWSTLKDMHRSPLHYRHRTETPRGDTSRMAFGRAVHTAVLEPDRFPLEYVVFDGPRRAGKAWEEFAQVNAARTILRADEYQTALAVRDAVRADKDARRLLRRGRAEVTLRWIDPQTRLRCKARLDWLVGTTLVDVKTTADIDARVFGRLADRMLYHGQLGFYRSGLDVLGLGDGPLYVVAVEAEPPHDVGVFRLPIDAVDAGMDLAHGLLARVRDCRKRRRWPGRYSGEQELVLPSVLYATDDDELELTGLKEKT